MFQVQLGVEGRNENDTSFVIPGCKRLVSLTCELTSRKGCGQKVNYETVKHYWTDPVIEFSVAMMTRGNKREYP